MVQLSVANFHFVKPGLIKHLIKNDLEKHFNKKINNSKKA